MRLILVRHGQIVANKKGRWHGSTDSPLTWTGRRQAKRTGRWLSKKEQFDAVYTSPLQRCRDTAAFAATAHEATVIDELAEMHIGDWEDMPFSQLHEEHNFFRRCTEDPTYCAPNGESLGEVAKRMKTAFDQIQAKHEEGETILVVSHGVALSIGLAELLEQDASKWRDYQFANCSISEVKLTPRPLLVALNQTFHL